MVSVVSFRWFRFGVSGFSTCHIYPHQTFKFVLSYFRFGPRPAENNDKNHIEL